MKRLKCFKWVENNFTNRNSDTSLKGGISVIVLTTKMFVGLLVLTNPGHLRSKVGIVIVRKNKSNGSFYVLAYIV